MNMEGNLVPLTSIQMKSSLLHSSIWTIINVIRPFLFSNSSIQLPGFCMPPMLKDDDGGIDSDGESFEAVTPEHNDGNHDGERNLISTVEKRSHILEDVDGELEMEDVSPYCHVEVTTSKMPSHQSDSHCGPQDPQQPKDQAMTYAPVSRSPLPPPQLHPPAVSAFPHNSVSNGHESRPHSSCQVFFSPILAAL